MILISCIFLFLATFFLMISFPAAQPVEKEIARRMRRWLAEDSETKPEALRLERKDRLSDLPLLEQILRHLHWTRSFRIYIRQSAFPLSTGAFVLISLIFGSVAFLLASVAHWDWPVIFPWVAGVSSIPFVIVSLKRLRRFKKFSEAFPDAISRMASSLRAGYSAQMAFEALVEDTASVVAEEFKKVVTHIQVGESFEEALKKMLERVDTPELRLFISSVILQRDSGGNLAQLLDNLEETIRARFELQRELNAASAQGKLSGMVLGLLPIFVGFLVLIIHREYILFFFQDPVGKKLLALCVTGQLMGFWTIRKIVRFSL